MEPGISLSLESNREHLANGGLASILPASQDVACTKLLEPLIITENDIRPKSFLASSRPPHTLLQNVLPSLLSKQLVIGIFLDYPSQGEAEEAATLLRNLGLSVKVGPASGRVLRDQVWWKKFVVVAIPSILPTSKTTFQFLLETLTLLGVPTTKTSHLTTGKRRSPF